MNPITTEQATIRTASVEVKTLTLGKKQMTLSVFRQLPCEHIIDPATMTLRGTPWGIVNYFWKDCGYKQEYGDHLHVIWEKTGRLLRACVGTLCKDWAGFMGDKALLDVLAVRQGDKLLWNNYTNGGGAYSLRVVHGPGLVAIKETIGEWNQVVNRLAALDQLFIAV